MQCRREGFRAFTHWPSLGNLIGHRAVSILAAARRSEVKGSADRPCAEMGGFLMLYWAVVFLVIAVVAAVFGFGGIASAAAGIAKILFFLFVVVFVVLLVMGLMGRRAV
jgi:uncharacterized membrane protein YtjA (UPF0391 family)